MQLASVFVRCSDRRNETNFAIGHCCRRHADSNLAPRRAFHRAVAVALGVVVAAGSVVEASSPGKPQPGSSMKAAIAYKPLAFADVPGWDQDDHAAAFKAFLSPASASLRHARERAAADKAPPASRVRSSRHARRQAALPAPSARLRRKAFFERYFTANAVAHSGPRGLLTGYYEPLVQGSRTPQGAFQTPIYKRPADLVNLVDETQRGAVGAGLSHARKTDKGTEPYPTRAQIEQGALKDRTWSCSISPTRSRCSSCRCRDRGASS